MSLGLTREQALRLRSLSREDQIALISGMTTAELLRLDAAFDVWANDGQWPPNDAAWTTWLIMAGRGFGKTRAGAEWILQLAGSMPMRIALVGATIDEARAVMIEGASGVLTLASRRRRKVKYEPSKGTLRWPNGSIATLYSGDNPDGLRGPEHHVAWCDELAKWRRAEESWMNLEMGLRCGARPRALVTTTPRPMRLLDRLLKRPQTVTSSGRTTDNVTLPRSFIETMMATYGGSRIGRQELDGELMSEAEGSLFPRELLERSRVSPAGEYERVVVAVDPPVSGDGDGCGIVVAARTQGAVHVLADKSVAACSPERWAAAVARAAEEFGASHVVAEGNQGGAMVRSVLKAADAALRVTLVHASRGKSARAEPVAIRMETGKAKLAGIFPELEAELSGMLAGGGYEGPGRSPDRADACVWAVTELSETRSGVPRVRAL